MTHPQEVRNLEQLLADKAVAYATRLDHTGRHIIEGAQHAHGIADAITDERAADVLHALASTLADMGHQLIDEAQWLADSNSALLADDIDQAIRAALDGGDSTT